ncbi:TrbC/VirB2 family protein [Legionella sp. km772]|uniref:TrbC/VirB2 family protein n=1 Tax=Legionella sp. km772 TaxID=2498111 RepID=UPI000F8EF818|nr:TrbC/VirB2 family protein [Legionella sp. km772]RUR10820.1 hypothetical protein ELY15_07765 [Legionella sp. km772]
MSSFKKIKQKITLTYLIVACALFPCSSQAQSVEGILNRSAHYLQGGIAKAVGFLCIVIAGFMCFRGKFPKEYFVMILIGLGIIFGAGSIYSYCVG